MSDIMDRIKITFVDGEYDTWTRTIDLDFEGVSYRVTLDYHEKYGIIAKWLDKSQNKIEEPTWVSEDEMFYFNLGEEARTNW